MSTSDCSRPEFKAEKMMSFRGSKALLSYRIRFQAAIDWRITTSVGLRVMKVAFH